MRLFDGPALGGPQPVARFAGNQEATVCAVLALEAPRAVSVAELHRALWDAPDEPRGARNIITQKVSGLRERLVPSGSSGPGSAIEAVGAGDGLRYRLTLDLAQIDARRFRTLVDLAARAARSTSRALICAEEALALWGEGPLVGLPDALRRGLAADLEADWLRAHELRFDARLALRQGLAASESELAQLARDHPCRRFGAQLVRLVFVQRDRAAALKALEQAEEALVALGQAQRGRAAVAARELERLRHELDGGRIPSVAPADAGAPERRLPFSRVRHPVFLAAAFPARRAPSDAGVAAVEAEAGGGQVLHLEAGHALCAFPDGGQAALAALSTIALGSGHAQVALHAGSAVVYGDVLAGAAGGLAGRLATAAHPGQVLVSPQAAAEIRPAPSDGVALVPVGELAGWDGEPAQLAHRLLRASFPPPLARDLVENTIPRYDDTFIGRRGERRAAAALLGPGRVVTLHGTGGCGKTRLAAELATEFLPGYPGGVDFVRLAEVVDPALVAQEVARQLRLPPRADIPREEAVAASLGARRAALLVLDNCEQVRDGVAELVRFLLDRGPGLPILVTSRIALGVDGERLLPVSPLPGPESREGAVELLLDRAGLARDSLPAVGETAAAEIVRRCAGLPLALQLAAAPVRAVARERGAPGALAEVARALEQGTSGLGDPDAGGRHASMHAAIAHSYRLLDPAEQELLRALALFPGGVAEAELAAFQLDPNGPQGDVDRLVDAALAEARHGARRRFHLLEPIRDFARVCDAPEDERADLEALHARIYCALAERCESGLRSADERATLLRLRGESGNLATALDWAGRHDAPAAQRLAGALWLYWLNSGELGEGVQALRTALALEPAPQPRLAARLLHALSHLSFWMGDYATCRAVLGRTAELELAIADARWSQGWTAVGRSALETVGGGDVERALELNDEARLLFDGAGCPFDAAYAAMCRVFPLWEAGRDADADAAAAGREAIGLARAYGSPSMLCQAMWGCAITTARAGDPSGGTALAEEALGLAVEQGNRLEIAFARNVLGSIAGYAGDADAALHHHAEGLEVAAAIGELWSCLWSVLGVAAAAVRYARYGLATRLVAAITAIQLATGHRHRPAEREQQQRVVASCRGALPPEDYRRERAAGAGLSLADACAQALACAHELSGGPLAARSR